MFKLLRHFSVMCALATAGITLVLVAGFYWNEHRHLDQLAEDRNVAQAYAFVNVIWPKYAALVAHPLGTSGDVLRSHPLRRELAIDVRQMTRGTPVLKVKIFTRDGLTIFSSEEKQIGESKAKDPQFIRAKAIGQPVSKSGKKEELNSFETTFKDRIVAESYVPIADESGNLLGVIELYSDISAYVGEIERRLWNIVGMLVFALATLYVLLLLVVRRADRILVGQYQELETFSGRLEDMVEERTKRLLNQQSVLSWVTKSEEFRHGNQEVALGNLTRVTAGTLGVGRVSIWMFDASREVLRCADIYNAETGNHAKGDTILVEKFPQYFDALLTQEHIVADNAVDDSRTKCFAESHFKPLRIGSMLDVPIVHAGRVEGVLCIEHVGASIKWTAEQTLFAIAIANFASLTLERQERLKAEEDLREANRSVEAANKAKSLFLANMSHEIRTPMNGVFGMTDLLMRTELNDRQRKFVGIISNSAKRLLTIINDILDLSRIEAGKLDLDSHDFALRGCVEDTVDLLAGEAQRKGLELNVYIASDVPDVVTGDSGRLRQVVTNLVSNSIKFTSTGSVSVRITSEPPVNGTALTRFDVRDTGIGIPDDIQEGLFKPFQQADTSISRRFGGTGLGLSISRHIIELMGGSVQLESKVGEGTAIRFELKLPVSTAKLGAAVDKNNFDVLKGQRILVLDDRATNNEVVQAYFNDCGAKPFSVSSAKDAYSELCRAEEADEPYALAVVDMLMEGANGLEFAQMIRANSKLGGMKLIMLTSMSWKGDARIARELGFGAFLTKPVHRTELLCAASQLLGGKSGAVGNATSGEATGDARPVIGLNVLVAEDNPVNLEVAREYLEGLSCQFTAAENGAIALDAVRKGNFDIVLMDCQMPEMDGLTATRAIREMENASNRRPTVIIAVTANAYAEDREACLAAGMDDYVSKPFSEEQLRKLLLRWGRSGNIAKEKSAMNPSMNNAETFIPAVPPQAETAKAIAEPAKVLDTEMLQRMQKTHPTLLGRLISTYLSYAPKAVLQLREAMDGKNHAGLKSTSHSLKSSSANLGAIALSAQCRELEARLKATTDWDDAANAKDVAAIEATFASTEAALTQLQSEIKPVAAAPAKAVGA